MFYFKQVVPISMESIQKLIEIVAKLRSPGGCPWDLEQTHASLIPHLTEESYEVVDEIEKGEIGLPLQEELGDLLLQIVLHAQIALEDDRFSFQDVVNSVSEKLIRRHPHVFDPNWEKIPVGKLRKQWERIKSEEKGGGESILDGIPISSPALIAAKTIGEKTACLGFDWEDYAGVVEKIEEELEEVKKAINSKNTLEITEEIGDLLFATANLARHFKIEPETALKNCNEKFKARFKKVETAIRSAEKEGTRLTLVEMEELWENAKNEEK